MEPDSEVWNYIKKKFEEQCGEEEWNKKWYLFRQMEKSHWIYEDCFCKKHNNASKAINPSYRCYQMKVNDNEFYEALLSVFPKLRLRIGDLKAAERERNIAMCKITRIGAILMDIKSKKFLLVEDATSHSYMFPRGKMNKGETMSDCLYRELREEVNLDLERCPRYRVCKVKTDNNGGNLYMFCFIGHFKKQHLTINCDKEVRSYKWCTLSEIKEIPPKRQYMIKLFERVLLKMQKQSYCIQLCADTEEELYSDEEYDSYTLFRQNHKKEGFILKQNKCIVNDDENDETFGEQNHNTHMTVDEYIAINAKIEHRSASRYNGNPQTFGESDSENDEESDNKIVIERNPYVHYGGKSNHPFSFDYQALIECFHSFVYYNK